MIPASAFKCGIDPEISVYTAENGLSTIWRGVFSAASKSVPIEVDQIIFWRPPIFGEAPNNFGNLLLSSMNVGAVAQETHKNSTNVEGRFWIRRSGKGLICRLHAIQSRRADGLHVGESIDCEVSKLRSFACTMKVKVQIALTHTKTAKKMNATSAALSRVRPR